MKRNKRKTQREAARAQKQAETDLAMEEEEDLYFNRPESTPDTPRVSRNNTPDPEESKQRETDYTVVLEMVQNVRDRLAALILDNTNIRAACDDLRRQCHSQGVAFGDLSRLVKQSREDQEETRAYTQEETRPHPRIRPELIDGGGNLRAEDIGITWQDGDTLLHGVRIEDGGTTWKTTVDDRRRRHHTRRVEEKWRTHVTGRRCRPLTRRVANTRRAICQHRDFHVRCVLRCPTHPHSNTPHNARRDVLAIDRRRPYSGSTTRPSGGQLGSVTSRR